MFEEHAFKWLNENQLSYDIWDKKYRYNNETLDEWFDRVSGGNKVLRQLIVEKKFLFGGRALANRGTNKSGSMFNCYSSGYAPDDSKGLLDLNTNLGLTYKAQGGQGLSLSKLRPEGTPIGKEFKSDGIVPWMELFNQTTSSVSQGGARKGALMMSLDIRHKEAETFIKIKTNEDKITKANLSLEIDDEFMEAVQEYYTSGKTITLHERREYNGHIVEYDIVPIKLYKLMMETVYDWAEPGCLFTEKFRHYNLMEFHPDYEIATCNPCGEQPLPKNFSCNLGSINLAEFVTDPFTPNALINYNELNKAVAIAVASLDTIIDENLDRHALKEQSDNSKNYRNIGLGVMGYANMLFELGIPYGSKEAIALTNKLFKFIQNAAVYTSLTLATTFGTFPKCNREAISKATILKYVQADTVKQIAKHGLRNCSLLSIAPTGSIATMLGVSGGCEPEFALSYTRHTENLNESYKVYCKSVKDYCKVTGADPDDLPNYFITSSEINWKDRLLTQATMQKYVDTAISSTINLKEDCTLEEIEQMYLKAWQYGLKGLTIYRAGCKRSGILVEHEEATSIENTKVEKYERGYIVPVPCEDVIGFEKKLMTGCGSLHVQAYFNIYTGDLVHTYLSKGSTGGCNNFMIALSRMISAASRAGVSIDDIVDQLMSTGACPSYASRTAVKDDTSKGSCCPMAVGFALKEMWEDFNGKKLGVTDTPQKQVVKKIKETTKSLDVCPECGAPMEHSGGCDICKECGYSHCG